MTVRAISFELNDEPVTVLARPLATLQSALHDELGMTGTKAGCRQGGCGSCTVHVDGEPTLSCLVPVDNVEGRAVTTIEGLGSPDGPSAIQDAFHSGFATQCGFCSPGMVAVAAALLERTPDPTRDEIGAALAGNICRCTGITPIIDAVEDAASRMRESKGATE